MSTQLSLKARAQVTLDVYGHGRAQVGPEAPDESWLVTRARVSVATRQAEAESYLYSGLPGAELSGLKLLDATWDGSAGDSCGPSETIRHGEQLVAVWIYGDPGQVATLDVRYQVIRDAA